MGISFGGTDKRVGIDFLRFACGFSRLDLLKMIEYALLSLFLALLNAFLRFPFTSGNSGIYGILTGFLARFLIFPCNGILSQLLLRYTILLLPFYHCLLPPLRLLSLYSIHPIETEGHKSNNANQ